MGVLTTLVIFYIKCLCRYTEFYNYFFLFGLFKTRICDPNWKGNDISEYSHVPYTYNYVRTRILKVHYVNYSIHYTVCAFCCCPVISFTRLLNIGKVFNPIPVHADKTYLTIFKCTLLQRHACACMCDCVASVY